MKRILTIGLLASLIFIMLGCAAQNNQALNNQRPEGQQAGPPSFSQLLAEMDANKDGKLSKAEVKGPLASDFSKIDADDDGFITESELANAPTPKRRRN